MKKKILVFVMIISSALAGCSSNIGTKMASNIERETSQTEETETKANANKRDKYEELKERIAEKKNNNETTEESDEKKETAEEVGDKLDIKVLPTSDMTFAVFVTNNSNTVIDDLRVQLEYLDENNQVIDLDTDYHELVLPAHTVVSRMEVTTLNFDDVQVSYSIELYKHIRYVNHADEVEISASQGNDCVIVQIKNNADVYIDKIEYVVALYNGDELISLRWPESVYNLGAGQSTTDKVDIYNSVTYDDYIYGVNYDRIEVYINEANTIGF